MLIFYKKHFSDSSWLLTQVIQAAIYGRGTMEYIFRQRKHLELPPLGERYRLLVLGSTTNCKHIEKHCVTLGIKCTPVIIDTHEAEEHELPYGEILAIREEYGDNFTHIVFDNSCMSYSDIFTFMMHEHAHKDRNRMRLGMYSPSVQSLVFEADTYSLKD